MISDCFLLAQIYYGLSSINTVVYPCRKPASGCKTLQVLSSVVPHCRHSKKSMGICFFNDETKAPVTVTTASHHWKKTATAMACNGVVLASRSAQLWRTLAASACLACSTSTEFDHSTATRGLKSPCEDSIGRRRTFHFSEFCTYKNNDVHNGAKSDCERCTYEALCACNSKKKSKTPKHKPF